MKYASSINRWFVMCLALLLLLSACERPIPGGSDSQSPNTITTAVPDLSIPSEPVDTIETDIITPEPSIDTNTETTEPDNNPEEQPIETIEQTPDPSEQPADPTATPELIRTDDVVHVVQAGDTVFSIAIIYGVTIDDIVAANSLTNANDLSVGQSLIIPAPGSTIIEPTTTPSEERIHIVQTGENLYRIGLQYGFTVAELATYNNISDPNDLDVGQEIRIPPTE